MPKPGDLIFEDYSGDEIINSDDRILIDETDAPEIFYGINLDATWKAFTLGSSHTGTGEIPHKQNSMMKDVVKQVTISSGLMITAGHLTNTQN